jgi:hypothetical protein
MLHRLVHWLGLSFAGEPQCWHRPDSVMMAGYQCSTCGRMFLVHVAPKFMQRREDSDNG